MPASLDGSRYDRTALTHVADTVAHKVKEEVHRPDFGLRLIIAWKAIKVIVLLGLGITAFALVHSDLHAVGLRVVEWLGMDAGRPTIARGLAKLTGLTPSRVTWIGVGAIIYACVLLVEAWGLHQRRVWAEWLTVIVTSSLIPLEVYELVHAASLGKVIALVVNIAIVLYLMRHRWLFRR